MRLKSFSSGTSDARKQVLYDKQPASPTGVKCHHDRPERSGGKPRLLTIGTIGRDPRGQKFTSSAIPSPLRKNGENQRGSQRTRIILRPQIFSETP